ncbi:phosphatase PAP2 family protein [Sphingomonas sp. SUN039]|uniref:phosphatase PAP2 family protein n=1 Tax=Sphingomonas sp. SUN039 TaxID=2937787 RepID=UPI002164A5F2|nr:phosphatase PAP2 family protein [Sphingomonas sp. SUN039]UVO54840.1 phosphatase PAP2 family protein [Sphingomonas sp. SUN039]
MNRRIATGAALVAAAVALGFAIVAGWLAWFDTPVMYALALTGASPRWLVAATQFVTELGDVDPRSVFVILVCIVLIARHCWRSAVVYLITVSVSIMGHTQAKLFYGRARPRLTPWFDQAGDLSFPSGHAGGAMVVLLAAALLMREGWLRWPALGIALAIAVTRPMLGVHWPTDIIGGALWGAGFALIGAGVAGALGLPKARMLQG